jgi:competence protein ComEC
MAARFVAPHSPQSAAIVVAILIGDRVGLGEEVQRRLQSAGTYHVIAISGGNVALLTALCIFILRLLVRSARASALIAVAVIIGYGWVVGGGASVNRAVAGATLYLLVSLAGLVPSAVNVLGVVAMLLALIDPLTTVDVGAWLSFGASFSIILCASRFVKWTAGTTGTTGTTGTRALRIPRPLLMMFAATLAAELALAPVSALVFSRVGVAGLVLNFIAIPAMSVVEIAGLAATALSGWWDFGARIAGFIASTAASILVSTSSVIDTPSLLSWRVPPSSPAWTMAYYAGAAVFLWHRARGWRRAAGGVTALASLLVILTAPGLETARQPAGWLRVTVLDVGQGDSILVQFPTGHSLLVDGGGAGGFDIGGRVVTPALWASGVRRLDYLAFTHPDLDHIGGVRSLARDMAPREIWEGVPVPRNVSRQNLWAEAQGRAIVWRQLSAGHVITLGSVEVDVINPPLADWERQRTRNEDSLVLRLRFADVEMLLTGDAGQEFETRPGAADRAAPVRLLKVGHHGSRSSSTPDFVRDFDPQMAFISVGRSNLFGHPAPDVLARYQAIGATIFRTDQDGAIVIETDGRDVRVRTLRGRTWTMMVRRD